MESLSDIVAQMRGRGEDGRVDRHLWNEYADRIEAAAKRVVVSKTETPTVGNAAAMREALVAIREALLLDCGMGPHTAFCVEVDRLTTTALSAPARQCDVGTAEEQTRRMNAEYCAVQKCCYESPSGRLCPLYKKGVDCRFIWAQTPYAEEGDGDGE